MYSEALPHLNNSSHAGSADKTRAGCPGELAEMSANNTRKSVERLCEEYPAIRRAVDEAQVLATKYGAPLRVRAYVQRGDASLMYWRPDDVRGGGDYMAEFNNPDFPDHPNLEGIVRTSVHLVLENGDSGGTVEWLVNYEDDDPLQELFLGDVFDTSMLAQLVMRRRGMLVAPEDIVPVEHVKQIALVTTEEWYPAGSNQVIGSPRAVTPIQLRLCVVLYKEPRKGWRHLRNATDLFHNVPLHGWRLLPGFPVHSIRFRRLNEKLRELAAHFHQAVWMTGLGHLPDEKPRTCMLSDILVYTYSVADEVRVHLQRESVSILMAAPENPDGHPMRVVSVEGTLDELTILVEDASARWLVLDAADRVRAIGGV